MFFADTDLYKWLEAASYELAIEADQSIERRVTDSIELIGDAQMDDGYINTYFQITGIEDRWVHAEDHSFFCVGHLIQAAVAHARCTGKTNFLQIACRLADHVDSIFGPGKREGAPDHPGVEVALVELHRETGEARYLDLCQYFIDMRGRGLICGGHFRWAHLHKGLYAWDKVPIREAKEAAGHAVMQVYLLAGVADLYLETGEEILMETLLRLWADITNGKMSINGGVGVRPKRESFGADYELPNEQGYNETCAQIGSIMWNWRMLLATGDARYADLLEWTFYNGLLPGVSLDGTRFFYGNTLLSRGGGHRSPWSGCACCPPNVMRALSSVHSFFVTTSERKLQLHLYDSGSISADIDGAGPVTLTVDTRYPWEGFVRLSVTSAPEAVWGLCLRIPAWCKNATLAINGEPTSTKCEPGSYAVETRTWRAGDVVELDLSMPVVRVAAHPRVEPTRSSVALTRGPILYCVEDIDQPGDTSVMDITIDATGAAEPQWQAETLDGVTVLSAPGLIHDRSDWNGKLYRDFNAQRGTKSDESATGRPPLVTPFQLRAIPYYAWANREPVPMRVWIPLS